MSIDSCTPCSSCSAAENMTREREKLYRKELDEKAVVDRVNRVRAEFRPDVTHLLDIQA